MSRVLFFSLFSLFSLFGHVLIACSQLEVSLQNPGAVEKCGVKMGVFVHCDQEALRVRGH